MGRTLVASFVTILFTASAAAQRMRPEVYVAGAAGMWSNRVTSGKLFGVGGGVDVPVASSVALEAESFVLVARGGFVLALSPGAKVRFGEWRSRR